MRAFFVSTLFQLALATMVVWIPFAFAGEVDDFLSVSPAVPVTVICNGEYTVYPYGSGNKGLEALLVASNGEPVFDFETYRSVASAYLYKKHVSESADNIRLLTPSAVPTFSQLLSKMKDEEYDISVARNYSKNCFPDIVSRIDGLESLRSSIVSELDDFVKRLQRASQDLVEYLKSDSVNCQFSPDISVYDQLLKIVDDLSTYESLSKRIRADLATTDTNCSPDVVQAISSALKPPFTSDQLQYFTSSAPTEKELLNYSVSDDEIRTLLQNTIRKYWKALYEMEMDSAVKSDFGSMSLRDAANYVITTSVPWKRADEIPSIRRKLSEISTYVSKGDYKAAYDAARDLKELVSDVLSSGVQVKRGFSVPGWTYPIGIIIAGVLLWRLVGGHGGRNEEDVDSDDYGYDYA